MQISLLCLYLKCCARLIKPTFIEHLLCQVLSFLLFMHCIIYPYRAPDEVSMDTISWMKKPSPKEITAQADTIY